MTDTNIVRLPVPPKPRRRAERLKLTTKRIADIKATGKRQRIADAAVVGLHLVVTPSGAKSFVVRGRIRGAKAVIDVTIGTADAVTLSEARDRAGQALATMRLGDDPRSQKVAQASTADMVEDFLEDHRRRGTASVGKASLCLGRVIRGLRQTSFADVSRHQWSRAIQRTYSEGGWSLAREDAKHLKALGRWADRTGRAEGNTARLVTAPEPSHRDRVARAERQQQRWTLHRPDQRQFWQGTAEIRDPVFAGYLRALALTGLRRGEAASALWDHIDLEAGVWRLPPSATKTGTGHMVFFEPGGLLHDVLSSLPGPDLSPLTFPGRGGAVMSGWSQRVTAVRKATGLPIRLHGLRRGYRTALKELGVDRQVAELMVGHAPGGVEGRYTITEMEPQRREAQAQLEAAWAEDAA